jgi:hypothetical protein
MKQNEYPDLPSLSMYRYETFFNVYTDDNDFKFYNILKNISIFPSENSEAEDVYYVKPIDSWTYISYKQYNTPDLWWLVCEYNQIQNPMDFPEPGTKLKLLKPVYVSYIISEINKQISS